MELNSQHPLSGRIEGQGISAGRVERSGFIILVELVLLHCSEMQSIASQ